ncbi:hypothetical protein Tco_1359354 [Tanacetum coccineum]
MCTYLKNIEGWKLKDLKSKSFANIQELFDKAMKKVNTFVDMDTELVKKSSKKADVEIVQESSSKRAGDELEQESIKKQKVDEDKETTELKSLMEVIPDEEEVAVDAIPLATKPPSIVDWKIHKEGKKCYYQIIRADRSSKMYLVFSHMLKSFDREDLETLYKLVKTKYGSTRPVEDLDLVLYGDLKTMFDPHVEDQLNLTQAKEFKIHSSGTNNFDDLDFFKDFENEFLAIVYNDGLTSKLDFLTEPTVSPQHIDEFDLKDETSLSECDEEEQNVLYFNDLFPFNVIYPDDLKLDKDNDNDIIDIK